MAALTIPHSPRRSACASRATTAGVGRFPLLTVLVHVADEHPAVHAGTRTQALAGKGEAIEWSDDTVRILRSWPTKRPFS